MEQLTFSNSDLTKVLSLTVLAFMIAMLVTPFFINLLYKYKLGKRIRETGYDEKQKTPIFYKLHKGKENTPTMGGILIWVVAGLITLFFNFTRSATWLPLFALVSAGIIGFIDDLMNVRGIGPNNGGLRFKYKLILYIIIAIIGALWFYYKLDWTVIHIPGGNYLGLPYNVELGWWYIPLFVVVLVGTAFASNETDGLDGLLGGIMAICFVTYAMIALVQGNTGIAAFCGTVAGAILAFLWFNIYPARFFMGDTGSMALGMTLAVVAFLTNSVVVLPVIAFVLVIEALSVIIQMISRKFFGKKIFLSTPIHHHFEALGWPETKVTMRFWVISAAMAVVGLVIALIGRG